MSFATDTWERILIERCDEARELAERIIADSEKLGETVGGIVGEYALGYDRERLIGDTAHRAQGLRANARLLQTHIAHVKGSAPYAPGAPYYRKAS